jgi:hypothetical protein
MPNGKKVSPEKAEKGRIAHSRFTGVIQQYGNPEELSLEDVNEIRKAYDTFNGELAELDLKLSGKTQTETDAYMQKVDARYSVLTTSDEQVIEAEVVPEEGETQPQNYQAPQMPTDTAYDVSAKVEPDQTKVTYDSIELLRQKIESMKTRSEARKAKNEEDKKLDEQKEAADKELWGRIRANTAKTDAEWEQWEREFDAELAKALGTSEQKS